VNANPNADAFQNLMLLILCPKVHLWLHFHEVSASSFYVKLLRGAQTDRQSPVITQPPRRK